MGDQLETFMQGEKIKTGIREAPRVNITSFDTYSQGEITKTETNFEEDKSIKTYQFDKYEVEVKLDSDGKLLSINGHLTPKRKKYFKELFRLDEEFPEGPLE
jgi:hypothetical protein